MFFDEHNPPHFHVRYNEYKAIIDINTCNIIEGNIPIKVRILVIEWAEQHRNELLKNWELTQNGENPLKVLPLV